MKPKFEVGEIIREHIDKIARDINTWQYRTLDALGKCRTPALGWHEDVCTDCGTIRYSYNSCRNRHCPKCQTTNREAWMMAREEELLPVPYFHVVFTLPDSLNELCYANQSKIYGLLFACARETLLDFGWDRKFLGAEIGTTMILHTWGQTLSYHPHLHCIVPGGGIGFNGRWKNAKKVNKGFIFPVKAMSKAFRGKFCFGLKRLFAKEKLRYDSDFDELYKRLYAQKWVVYAKRPFAGAKGVVEYLGRYTHKVAISNHRLIDVNDIEVVFSYKDYRDGKTKRLSLAPREFLRRFVMHILPRGFVRIRHYGFLSGRLKKEQFTQAKHDLGETDYQYTKHEKPGWQEICEKLLGFKPMKCPHCGGDMIRLRSIPPIRSPSKIKENSGFYKQRETKIA